MTSMIANLLVNILMVVLLVLTIGYCWVLNRRIKVLQDSKSELAQLLRHFDESTQRASESIISLQTASRKIGENIQTRIEKANYVLDDLAFMIERGNKVANQIEAGFAVQRARTRIVAAQPQATEEAVQEERMLEESKVPEKPQSNRERTVASLEAVLERVVERSKQMTKAANTEMPTPSRSRSEQELLTMIKSGGVKG